MNTSKSGAGMDPGDADSFQVKAPVLSLPKGGGAIRGMGEKFAANPVSGGGSTSVPIAVSPGRGGFGPQLALNYDSGAGNGPFGLGWNLGLPAITRKTDKGLPQYRDDEESDVFLLSGAEDLVPVLEKSGEHWRRRPTQTLRVDASDYLVDSYRPRIEGLFARIERWTHKTSGDVHWRSISKDNLLTLYGKDRNSRIHDPQDPSRIFSWLISETRDDKGNAMVYRYKAEDGAGLDLSCAHERNRGEAADPRRASNRYIKRILYGNRHGLLDADGARPALLDAARLDAGGWMFEVVFDYGEHDVLAPGSVETTPWVCRVDPFSSYRAGFEVRTARRCRRVLMYHHFPGEPQVGDDCLVRSTDLGYSDEIVPADVHHPVYTFLQTVTQTGYRRKPDGYDRSSLPPVEFTYSKPVVQDQIEDMDEASLENLPMGVDGGAYRWTDLHGEGLPGVLTEQSGAWFYKRNLSPLHGDAAPGRTGEKARLGPMEIVASKPQVSLASGAEFMDLAGDGQADVVTMDEAMPGLFEHDEAEGWQAFRPFVARLNRSLRDPNLRFVDLDGDGHADVLISEDEALVWHAALGEAGFGAARPVAKAPDEERGPRIVFADGSQSIYLADMSGDGLTDLVRVRNGEVCYWPNLGHGRFGAKVAMDRAPHFDHPDQFDQRRIRLADIDGSGTTDILYLHRDGVRLYFNQSGNGWSAPHHLPVFPSVDDMAQIVTTDLLGNGTACLVWSSPRPGDTRRPLRYLNLMGRHKPHLLVRMVNHLGAETDVSYAPSTRFYLQDRLDGKPWITRLPFPVHVVERVETRDHVSRNRFVSRYAYHHGYFDGVEREFRGFGMVEQWDTEEISALGGDGSAAVNQSVESHVPPVLTRSWYHTGVYFGADHISNFYAGLLNGKDRGEYFREPGLSDSEAAMLLLPDTELPAGLNADEAREACRALKGALLRQEIYALDGSEQQPYPYVVTEQSFGIRTLQPRAGLRHAVFLTHAREAISYHYERNPADPRVQHALTLEVDTYGNVLKQVTVGYGRRQTIRVVDGQGQVRQMPNPGFSGLSADDQARQTTPLLTYTGSRFTGAVDGADHYRAPLPCETRTFELTGYLPTGAGGRFQPSDLIEPDPQAPQHWRLRFSTEVAYEVAASGSRCRRLLACLRTLYRRDDLAALLPLGELQALALPGESYKLAYTPGLLSHVFQRPLPGQPAETLLPDPAAVLAGQAGDKGGYVSGQVLQADGRFPDGDESMLWWQPSGRTFFSGQPSDDAATELARARRHFFLPCRYQDPFGRQAWVEHDVHDYLMANTRDALGNRVTVHANDYRVLQARLVSDPNNNQTVVAFDVLGMVAGTAIMGKPLPAPVEGDTLAGFSPDMTQAQLDAFFEGDDPHALAPALLQGATTRVVYDLHRFRRTREAYPDDPARWQPVCAATLARETHASASLPPQGLKVQLSFSYSDGMGREIQKKVQAEPGPLVDGGAVASRRWVGSGWTIFNNKGKPVRQYEPFFSARRRPDGTLRSDHRFEFGVLAGVSPVLFYDPVGRVVATLHPNHSYDKVVFDSWRQTSYDANDTCAPRNGQTGDPRTDPHVAGQLAAYFAAQDAGWQTWQAQRIDGSRGLHEQAAAQRAATHADTPTITHHDVLGRAFLTLAHNRVVCAGHDLDGTEERYATRVELDIEGRQRAVRDAVEQASEPQGRIVMRYDYDMLGNRIRQASMEAGTRWILNDVKGMPIRLWDSRGHRVATFYDALRRPVERYVRGGGGDADPRTLDRDRLVDRTEYGEPSDTASPAEEALAQRLNLRTRVLRHYDGAGVVIHGRVDATDQLLLAYDFKGNLLHSTRRLLRRYDEVPDWRQSPLLEDEAFEAGTRYDALNRPVQSIAPRSNRGDAPRHVVQPVFNESNLLERLDVWLERGSEPAGLLDAGVEAPSAMGVSNIDYDAKGQRLRIDYSNGATTFYDYDPLTLRLTHLLTRRDASAFPEDCPPVPATGWPGCQVQNLHYTYDPVGNLTHIHDEAQQAVYFRNRRVDPDGDYCYDALYRLVQAAGREHLGQSGGPMPHAPHDAGRVGLPAGDAAGHFSPRDGKAMGNYIERYVYDAVGNFLEMQHRGSDPSHPGWTREYSHAEVSLIEDGSGSVPRKTSNRLSRTTLSAGGTNPVKETYQHDAHGNMVRMPHLGGGQVGPAMHWDYKDQLHRVDLGGGGVAHYVYDAAGQRVRKVWEKAPGLTEERIYLGGFELFRRHAGPIAPGSLRLERETLHVMDDKQRIALVETRTLDVPGDDRAPRQLLRYQLGNHLGSASLELDERARIISYEEYTPYGSTSYQAVRSQTETAKRYRYTGKERDEESGLDYFGARTCIPWLGIWTSCDPAGIKDAASLYVYCAANPVNHFDPHGRDIRYFQILFLGVEPTDSELAEYNANPTAHNVAFAGAFVGVAGASAAVAVAAVPVAASTAAGTVKTIAAAGSVKGMILVAALNGETVLDMGNVAVASYDVAATGGSPSAWVGLEASVIDLATGPNPLGEVNTARVLSKPRTSSGRSTLPPGSEGTGGGSSPALPAGGRGQKKTEARNRKKSGGSGGGGGGSGGDGGKPKNNEEKMKAVSNRLDEIVKTGGGMPEKTRAVGAAIVDVPGYTGPKELRAVSSYAGDDVAGGPSTVVHALSPDNRTLPAAKNIGGSRGDYPGSHINDVEIKMLEEIRKGLPPGATGTIHIQSLRSKEGGSVLEPLPACASCTNAIFAFTADFPGIKIVSHQATYPPMTQGNLQ